MVGISVITPCCYDDDDVDGDGYDDDDDDDMFCK